MKKWLIRYSAQNAKLVDMAYFAKCNSDTAASEFRDGASPTTLRRQKLTCCKRFVSTCARRVEDISIHLI